MKGILQGLNYLQGCQIIHGAITLDTILISDGEPIIIEFGMSKLVADDEFSTAFSALEFCSPELIRDATTAAPGDVWSAGVVFLALLTGQEPFRGSDETNTKDRVCHSSAWKETLEDAPPVAAELCRKMLERRVEGRISAGKALKDVYFEL